MSGVTPSWLRERVRERFASRCGYCGVDDTSTGASLTVDHHRPRSQGGGENEENLVYTCPRCNEHKGAYWHEQHPPHRPLLHPGRDDLTLHLRAEDDGRLTARTLEGAFFIEKLRLNRAPLVAHRLRLLAAAAHAEELEAARERTRRLEQRIARLRAAVESTAGEIQQHTSSRRL